LKGSEDLLIEKQRKIHIHKYRLVDSMHDCTMTFATAHTRSLVGHWLVHANWPDPESSVLSIKRISCEVLGPVLLLQCMYVRTETNFAAFREDRPVYSYVWYFRKFAAMCRDAQLI